MHDIRQKKMNEWRSQKIKKEREDLLGTGKERTDVKDIAKSAKKKKRTKDKLVKSKKERTNMQTKKCIKIESRKLSVWHYIYIYIYIYIYVSRFLQELNIILI